MKVLVIGSGGREHALAWKLHQSEQVETVVVYPGNGGTPSEAIPHAEGVSYLSVAERLGAEWTLVGPEVPLAEGIVDSFAAAGHQIWGPTGAAARIESSKAFSKAFMATNHIPTATYRSFTEYEAARTYLLNQTEPIVIKASGLAAGKGVILPASPTEAETALRHIMLDQQFGAAGDEVVIEQRLSGPELSLMTFCDGQTALLMPAAQDHKRAFDNDEGPNTGGMGAFAPSPLASSELLQQVQETIIQPTLAGMAQDGRAFVGVLYVGLMLTADGPKVLEYNCRFGDPETQVVLPLLKTDLLTIVQQSKPSRLHELNLEWHDGAAATVVLASGGYPSKYEVGKPIYGLEEAQALDGVTVFHAGTRRSESGEIVTNGGRVLNVTGIGDDLPQAIERAYAGVAKIRFEGMHYRTDIGRKIQ